jgi:hypothetical protein
MPFPPMDLGRVIVITRRVTTISIQVTEYTQWVIAILIPSRHITTRPSRATGRPRQGSSQSRTGNDSTAVEINPKPGVETADYADGADKQ